MSKKRKVMFISPEKSTSSTITSHDDTDRIDWNKCFICQKDSKEKLLCSKNVAPSMPAPKKTYSELESRFEKIIEKSNVKQTIINGESLIGGVTLPNITLSSPVMVLDVEESENTLMKLISNEYPIIPRVVDRKINIDLRSVFENQDDEIAKFLNSL